MNYNDKVRVVRSGFTYKEAMACRFETKDALSIFSWGVGVQTQTAGKVHAVMHVPLTYTQFPELQFQGIDYVFYLISPKGYSPAFKWIIEEKRINRNHVTYLMREA